MRVIGLTGGIASGKSTILKMFQEKNIPIIDADVVAREVVKKESPVLKCIAKEFGEIVLNDDGTLNRRKLGEIVFENKENLKKLNSITHPAIIRNIREKLTELTNEGNDYCVIDAALLIESGLVELTDKVILVYANREIQLSRLLERDKLSLLEAKNRIESQSSFEEKKKYADHIIDNSGEIEYTKTQFNKILQEIL